MPTKKTLEFTTTRGVLLMIRELVVPVLQRRIIILIHSPVTGHHYASYSLLASLPVPATFWRSELLMGLIRLLWMPAFPHLRLQHLFRHLLLINPLHLMLLASQLNTMGSQKTT
jgi:hypothetical protein